MKRFILLTILALYCLPTNAQVLKDIYDGLFKYSTFYFAGDIGNSYQPLTKSYFVRTPESGDIYDVPDVIDVTEYNPFDYRIGFGLRKLARFDYEVKGNNFYNGTGEDENNVALSAPTASVQGFEYLIHWERERQRGEIWNNKRYFLRHTGKNHIAKIEVREEGNIGFEYQSLETRFRLPLGKKLSISAGAILRTHQTAFGYNPIERWLNEVDMDGNVANPWYTLGYEYGYTDNYVALDQDQDGYVDAYEWFWYDSEGNLVANSDLEFREEVFGDLMNRYNREKWDELEGFAEVAPIIGADFYHYSNNFWFHAYGSVILPQHNYIKGDVMFTYLHRNRMTGHSMSGMTHDPEQWTDYQGGVILGWKINRSLGLFAEGEYTKAWDRELFRTTFGLNYTFR